MDLINESSKIQENSLANTSENGKTIENNNHVVKHSVHNNNDTMMKTNDVSNTSNSWVTFDETETEVISNINERAIQMDQVIKSSPNQQEQQFAIIDLSNSLPVQINNSNINNKNNESPINKQPTNNSNIGNKSGFANGDIIVTLYPMNDNCAWITPATFKAHLVPEELMAQPLTLTVEDYVSTMSILLNDYRFHLYITLHKRILAIWISLSIIALLGILATNYFKGLSLVWLLVNTLGIFLVIFIKAKLYQMLEECLSQVNSIFGRHNIFLGIDDRGHFSCHKINLIFVYFDSRYCIKFLQDMLKNNNETNTMRNDLTVNDDVFNNDDNDIYITGSNGTKQISQKDKQAEKLLYRYSQRWIREYGRQRMSLSVINPQPATSTSIMNNLSINNDNTNTSTMPPATDIPPRHCRTAKCFCQYVEELYRIKHQTQQSYWNVCIPPLSAFCCQFK